MATFVISKRHDDEYKYAFTSRKGKTIFTSIAYELKFECEESINFLKENFHNCTFLKFKSSNGKFYFRLILNEKQIAVSRKYTTELRLQKGIDEVVKYGPLSEILDFSFSENIFGD